MQIKGWQDEKLKSFGVLELKGEVLKKPLYQEKKRVQMTFQTEVNLIVGLNVKWRILRKKPEKIQDLNGI